jgi:NADH dehydrogenase
MSETAGNKALSYLKRLGVTVHLQTRSTHYDGDVLKLDYGSSIRTRTVIWAAGVEPVLVPGLENSSIEGRRFKVNACSQVLAEMPERYHGNVFAIGDVSLMRTRGWPEGLPGMAPVAIQQGRHLALNLKRLHAGRTPKPFKYTDKGTMATIGRNCAVAEMKRRFVLSGFIGWVTWMVVHLWYLIGFRNKVIVSIDWLWNYFTYDRGIRAIIRPVSSKRN